MTKKIWSLMLLVMVALLAAGLGMTTHMKGLESDLRTELQTVEQRIRVVVELRGKVDSMAMSLVAANLVQDMQSLEFFSSRFTKAGQETNELLSETEVLLRTEAGRELFQRLKDAKGKVDTSAAQIAAERRNDGDIGGLVQTELVPAVQQFLDILNEMVARQEQLRADSLAAGDRERSFAFALGLLTMAVVVVLGLLMAGWLVRQLTAPLARAVKLADTIAAGDLTSDVHDDRQDEMGHLLRSLNAMTQKLRMVVGEVHNGVDSVSSASSQIATGNKDLSARTEQTAANLEETVASIEELTAAVSQSAETAVEANQLARGAVQAAERGGEVVQQVVRSMEQINTSSRKISDIIGVIDGIAFQTNILALNAAVEAARAGEQGRGFAVVAGEVRSLAGRSAEAAKEIKGLITASVSNVDIGSAQVAQAGESMQQIVASARRVTDLIGEISASATEQRDGINQVNQAVSNLDQMTQQNAALVEESSAAAVSMNEQAQRLSEVVALFNVGHSHTGVATRRPAARAAAAQPVMPARVGAVPSPRKPGSGPALSAKPAFLGGSHPAADTSLATPRTAPRSQAPVTAGDDDWETF